MMRKLICLCLLAPLACQAPVGKPTHTGQAAATSPVAVSNQPPTPDGAPSPTAQCSSPHDTETADMAWLIREAKLPEGFPPPGPTGRVTLKHYPAYRAAFAVPGQEAPAQNRLFQRLFNHIQRQNIAMTAPVEMTFSPSEATLGEVNMMAMAFLYRSLDQGTVGQDRDVVVRDVPAQTVLSVGVRGSYRGRHLDAALAKLRAHLETHPGRYELAGPPRVLGYNSPFVPPFLRYSEVQVPVRVIDATQELD